LVWGDRQAVQFVDQREKGIDSAGGIYTQGFFDIFPVRIVEREYTLKGACAVRAGLGKPRSQSGVRLRCGKFTSRTTVGASIDASKGSGSL
jgi:hypothetical protein